MNTAAQEKHLASTLALRERGKGEELKPRPAHGDHKKIVRAAAQTAISEHRDLLVELAKI